MKLVINIEERADGTRHFSAHIRSINDSEPILLSEDSPSSGASAAHKVSEQIAGYELLAMKIRDTVEEFYDRREASAE